MKRSFIYLIAATILMFPALLLAQVTVTTPEHATYDVVNDRYIICSFNDGKVVTINSDGVIDPDFITGLGRAYANHIVGDTLYVTSGRYNVKAFDLATGDPLWTKYVTGSDQLDGITADNNGYLYIANSAATGKIFKLKISDQTVQTFVSSGLPTFPQDLIFDEANNRLLLASFAPNAPIVAIDLSDSTKSSLVTTPFGNMDGIAMDNNGDIYVTCYTDGTIHKYDQSFTNPPLLISSMYSGPAGLGYNPVDNILAIPNFLSNRVYFVPLDDNDDDDVLDYRDNCPSVANTDQSDIDEDGSGDLCDGCPDNYNPTHTDTDADDVEDACDNCPEHYNPGQEDSNGNDVGDLCDYICGDGNSDGLVNILDIVYVINYKYKSGPAPDPLESADVNGDFLVNILDIVYLINYKYKSGPEPECVIW